MSIHTLKGQCKINPQKTKFENQQSDDQRDFVTIFMFLLRLGAPYDTDIVMSYYIPDKLTEDEQS